MVEVAVLCEQLGRRVAAAPFLQTVLALDVLRSSGVDALSPLVERLAAGEAVGCVAFSPSAGGSVAIEVSGSEGLGASVTLRGRTEPVVYGPSADVAVVVSGDAVYAVPRGDGPLAVPEPAMDRTRELGRLDLVDAPAYRVGDGAAVCRLLDRAATAMSAELLGVSDHALELAVAYAKDRVQFGKPIGSFQAVKHKCVDMMVAVENARSLTYYACWTVDERVAEAATAVPMAKAYASDMAKNVTSEAIQVHGGIGFTWEHDMHLYHRRALAGEANLGNAPIHREVVAKSLLG